MNGRLSKGVQTRTLSNGLTLVAAPFSDIKTVTLHAWVFVGSVYETQENNGISHFLEHMIFRGNQELGDAQALSLKMEELGGEINAATSYDHTEYWLDFHVDFLQKGIQRFCHFLTKPLFENMEVERQIILEEAKSDYNEENLLIDLDSLSGLNLWPNESMGMPIIGTPETIESLSLDQLRSWFEEHYAAKNMILGISGDIQPERVFSLLEEGLAGLAPKKRHSYQAPPFQLPKKGFIAQPHKDNQYQFQWSFPIEGMTGELRNLVQILSRMIDDGSSSRLQRLIREEKGLVYDISASFFYFKSGGMLQIQGTVGTDKVLELASTLSKTIADILDEGFTEAEFQLAKLRQQTAMDFYRDSAEGILQEEVGLLMNPYPMVLKEVLAYLEALTLDRVQAQCKKTLDQKSLFVLVGPKSKEVEKAFQRELKRWL